MLLIHKYYCDLLKDFSFYTHVHTNNAAGSNDSSTCWKNFSDINHIFLYCYHQIDLLLGVTVIVYNYSEVKITKNSVGLLFEHFATVIKVQII